MSQVRNIRVFHKLSILDGIIVSLVKDADGLDFSLMLKKKASAAKALDAQVGADSFAPLLSEPHFIQFYPPPPWKRLLLI